MLRRVTDICRWLAIALCAILFSMLLIPIDGHGLYAHCPLIDRLSYPLMHASLIHCSLNAWCFLAIVFFYDTAVWQMFVAYAVAVAVPSCLLSAMPTVGFSGVCFALMGIISFKVVKRWQFYLWIAFYLIIGFILPGINAWVHLFCYVAGWMVGFISTPLALWTRLTKS